MNILLDVLGRLDNGLGDIYAEMDEISRISCGRNLLGEWMRETVIVPGLDRLPVDEAMNRLHEGMMGAFEDRHREGHSVLHLGPDTLVVRPTEIFGRFDGLRLFWHTSPATLYGLPGPYLNGGVVYIPAEMPADLWDIGRRPLRSWGDSQEWLNAMFYAQDPVPELHPELNWCPHVPNPLPEAEAYILHFHGTRGAAATLARMREHGARLHDIRV